MTNATTISMIPPAARMETAWQDVRSSFERFCLTAGVAVLEQMLEEDAEQLAGPRHGRHPERAGRRWGATTGKIGFHGGKVDVRRPRIRSLAGREVPLPNWQAAQAEDWLGRWAMNLMLINVSTRKLRRAVRLPEGDLPAAPGDGTSKSAASRRFVALSAQRMAELMSSDLSQLDLVAIQIDGLHVDDDLVLIAALGIDTDGNKHPLGLMEGATENAAVVQALIDSLIERGLRRPEFVIVDGGAGLDVRARRRVERRARAAVYGPLCRAPDYADQRGQTGLGGGDRCEGSGIIRAPPGRREVCRWGGIGRAKSRLASFWPRRAL